MTINNKTAIIIGAGPAGLTAAYELLEKTDIKPIVFEIDSQVGGISKTVEYKGNRLDLGGHRFFSKSEKIMAWWFNIFPLQGQLAKDDLLLKRKIALSEKTDAPDPEKNDLVMLIRNRLSRIYFVKKFFNYPISLDLETVKNLGILRIIKIGFSYIKVKILPIKQEKSLEDFYINRFGGELYKTFFEDYTRKLWGVPCNQIKADWGSQRVKGLSITRAIVQALKNALAGDQGIISKKTEISLINNFYYPKFGPGQMWERVAQIIKDRGGEIRLNHEAVGLFREKNGMINVITKNLVTGKTEVLLADYVFSSMPIKDLIQGLDGATAEVKKIAAGLEYRDFITVGLLLDKLKINNQTKIRTLNGLIPDTWIYIQEPGVKMCRLQIFNNWSPYLISDLSKAWLGLEYVCGENDDIWQKNQLEMIALATGELEKMAIIDRRDIIDATVIKIKKAYPSYTGSYDRISEIKKYLDKFENLFCIGRNGLHRYNNMDHSMLTAMTAVDNIKYGIKAKDNIWLVNTEGEYHETK